MIHTTHRTVYMWHQLHHHSSLWKACNPAIALTRFPASMLCSTFFCACAWKGMLSSTCFRAHICHVCSVAFLCCTNLLTKTPSHWQLLLLTTTSELHLKSVYSYTWKKFDCKQKMLLQPLFSKYGFPTFFPYPDLCMIIRWGSSVGSSCTTNTRSMPSATISRLHSWCLKKAGQGKASASVTLTEPWQGHAMQLSTTCLSSRYMRFSTSSVVVDDKNGWRRVL